LVFKCPEENCPFESNKKENVTHHISGEHDLVFRIAKELFPTFTTEPQGVETTTNEPVSTVAPENQQIPSTAPPANLQIPAAAPKRRSTEPNETETEVKKQKLEKAPTRKIDLPMKQKINPQTATIRPIARDITDKDASSSAKKVQEKKGSKKIMVNQNSKYQMIPQNVMIIPPTVMENGQLRMENGQMMMPPRQLENGQMVTSFPGQYFINQGMMMPQWSSGSAENQPQPYLVNNFQM